MKHTTGEESNGKRHLFYGKSMDTNSPGLSHSKDFADFSNAMGKLMRKPMHFPCDKIYNWMESNGKKYPYYGKNMSTNFSGSPHPMGIGEYHLDPIS